MIEAGKTAIGRVGDAATSPGQFRTAQVRVTTTSTTPVNLTVLGTGVSGVLDVPVRFTGGGASGQLTEIICNQGTGLHTTDTTVRPLPIEAKIGTGQPTISLTVGALGFPVARVAVTINKTITPTGAGQTPILDQVVETTRPAPGAGLALGLGPIQSSDVTLSVTSGALPFGVTLNLIKAQLLPTINQVLVDLDVVGSPILNQLGVSISSSDLRLDAVQCESPLLVG